jgi:hypothetical protein
MIDDVIKNAKKHKMIGIILKRLTQRRQKNFVRIIIFVQLLKELL